MMCGPLIYLFPPSDWLPVFKEGDKESKSAGDKLCRVYRYIPSLYNMQNVVSKVRDNWIQVTAQQEIFLFMWDPEGSLLWTH